ncbi:MAG: autotransporter assembly complex protein TamA [Cypionkella sp.]
MGSTVSRRLWVGTAALGLGLAVALPGLAFDAVDFTVTGGDKGLSNTLRAASGLVGAAKDKPALDLFADARAEYAKLLSALYATGHYGPVIHVMIDGREAASIAPLDAPSTIRKIVVSVDPGPAFAFSQAEISPLANDTELPSGFATGKTAESGVIKAAVQAGVDGWRSHGNAKTTVASQDLTADHASSTLSAKVQLTPGPVLRFGNLTVKGAQRIRVARVQQIAGLPTGKKFDPADEARAVERLRRSGVFTSVTLTEDSKITLPDQLGITAELVEAKRRRYTFGAEVATNDGLGLNAGWLHRNLAGGGERLEITGAVTNISAAGSGLDYSLGMTLDRPATPGPDTTLNLFANVAHNDDADYTADTLSTGFGFTHYFNTSLTGRIAVSYNYSKGSDTAGSFLYRSLDLPIGVTWDRRDSTTDPTRNFYIDLNAKPFLGFDTTGSGARLAFDARGYKGFGTKKGTVLAVRFQGGAILGADALATPRTYLFYSGGGGTVRGQPYQSLGVTVDDNGTSVDIGGTTFLATSLEARVKVTDTIGLVGFIDAGAVGLGSLTGANADWQAGAGIGVRYATGVGPVRLDLALPVHGNLGGGLQVYVGLGQAF